MDASTLLITCATVAGVCGLVLGYALGRLDWIAGKVLSISKQPPVVVAPPVLAAPRRPRPDPGWADPVRTRGSRFKIDEAKFVAPVNTAGMERLDTNELGSTTVTEENVQDAVSRLAKLKGQ